jgi:FMN-dependent NADH-azoreductase
MKKILMIESSPRKEASFSRKLTQAIGDKLKEKYPGASINIRDLASHPSPHLEESHLAAYFAPPEKQSAADLLAIQHSQELITEILEADVIIIGTPVYNFSIPSVLKAWFDHLARAGKTFKYTANGPEGLVKGKKIYLAIASGAIFSEGEMKSYDFVEPYLRVVLGFLGMTDVTTIRVEGVAIPGLKETALERAVASIAI